MVTEKSKTCLDCHESLSVSLFHRKGIYWDSRCKPCALKHKKNHYINKKLHKTNCYNNIVIAPYAIEIGVEKSDLISMLESFLLEECISEQRISA